MKQYLSNDSVNALNELLREMFKANSVSDNISYGLQHLSMYNSSRYHHEKFSHIYPVWADQISTIMDKLGSKSERRSFDGDTNVYGDIVEAFTANVKLLEHIRERILATMEVLDYDMNNKEVILNLEDLSLEVLDLLYEANKILDYAIYYHNKGKDFQFDFKIQSLANGPAAPADDDD